MHSLRQLIADRNDPNTVVARINGNAYGPGSSVWSQDTARSIKVALQLDADSLWINRDGYIAPGASFAKTQNSVLGIEMGQEGLKEFTQTQPLADNKS